MRPLLENALGEGPTLDILGKSFKPSDHRTKDMSKIFDALKKAELARAKHEDTTAAGTGSAKQPNRRRTGRVNVRGPLFVYSYTLEGDPFHEEARTIAINAQGALISMRNVVPPGQSRRHKFCGVDGPLNPSWARPCI